MTSACSFEIIVNALGARGDGLAMTPDGRRVFVPFALPGERLRVRVTGTTGTEGLRAEIVDVLDASPERVQPICPHFGTCGGCALQHLSDGVYAEAKLDTMRTALARTGLDGVPLEPLTRTATGSRRRARFAALRKGRRILFGFNQRSSHRLTDVTSCPVLHPSLEALVPALRRMVGEILPEGGKADVMATLSSGGVDVLLIGPSRLDRTARTRLTTLAVEFGLARLSWKADDRRDSEPIVHTGSVAVMFDGVAVTPPPGAFLQASVAGENALVRAVLDATRDAGHIADLFAGLGTFSLPLARAASVAAVEGDRAAVDALNRCGHRRRLTATCRDLFEAPLSAKELARYDAVVFDPPRAGASAQAAAVAVSGVPVVVGVSCSPATFARDARTLCDAGYDLRLIHPVDQFLWSSHIELVGVFQRSS